MKGVGRRVALRSFFLETLWNYDKMQNVGFVFCIYPALRRIYPELPELKSAAWRQLESVNTHPSMGPLLAGITAKLEREVGPSEVMAYRKRVMAALAAHGDRIFWTHVKPLAAVSGALLTLGFFGSLIGSFAVLLVYNGANLYARIVGFSRGWTEGLGVIQTLKSPAVEVAVQAMRGILAIFLGLTAGLLVCRAVTSPEVAGGDVSSFAICLWLTMIASLGGLLLWKKVGFTVVVYVLGLAAVVVFGMLITGTIL